MMNKRDMGSNVNFNIKSDTGKAAKLEATLHLHSKVNCHSTAKFQETLTITNHGLPQSERS